MGLTDKVRIKLLVIELRGLAGGSLEPSSTQTGMCAHLDSLGFGSELRNVIYPIFKCWPEFSGISMFPVPCTDYVDACEAYLRTGNKWTDEYGEARKRLCSWLADELEKNITTETEGK